MNNTKIIKNINPTATKATISQSGKSWGFGVGTGSGYGVG